MGLIPPSRCAGMINNYQKGLVEVIAAKVCHTSFWKLGFMYFCCTRMNKIDSLLSRFRTSIKIRSRFSSYFCRWGSQNSKHHYTLNPIVVSMKSSCNTVKLRMSLSENLPWLYFYTYFKPLNLGFFVPTKNYIWIIYFKICFLSTQCNKLYGLFP